MIFMESLEQLDIHPANAYFDVFFSITNLTSNSLCVVSICGGVYTGVHIKRHDPYFKNNDNISKMVWIESTK